VAVYGGLLETNDEWAVAQRCMSLEALARVTSTAKVRLPGVVIRSRLGPGPVWWGSGLKKMAKSPIWAASRSCARRQRSWVFRTRSDV